MAPIKLGIIGAGIFAREQHVPAILALDGAIEVAAVCSRTQASAERLAALLPNEADIVLDMDALLAQEDIDAVAIALPIMLLPDAVERALKAGKHIISEKPIAPDIATGKRLLTLYAEHPDLVWMVAENYRYEAGFIEAAKIIKSGEIGKVYLADWAIHVGITPDNKYYNTTWRQNPTHPGGMLLDGGVHHIAALRLVLGEITSVSAQTTQHRSDLPPVDTASASLIFEGGAIGAYSVTYAGGAPWWGALQIVGEKGAIRIEQSDNIAITVDGETRQVPVERFRGVEGEFAAFAAAVQHGDHHRNSPQEALQDIIVMHAIFEAAQSGQRVVVQPIDY